MTCAELAFQSVPFALINQFTVDSTWNGAPLHLQVNQNANMPQTTNGTMVFAYENISAENNLGQIWITSGGTPPIFEYAQPLTNQPSMLMKNWRANNLSVTNISPNAQTPIKI